MHLKRSLESDDCSFKCLPSCLCGGFHGNQMATPSLKSHLTEREKAACTEQTFIHYVIAMHKIQPITDLFFHGGKCFYIKRRLLLRGLQKYSSVSLYLQVYT